MDEPVDHDAVPNRLWGQQSYEFLPAFLQVTRDKYGAELARLNFAQTEEARKTINTWVEEQTQDKITGLIPVEAISSDTKLVLTNAVYFHGIWAEPFEKDRTKDEDFHLTAADKIKARLEVVAKILLRCWIFDFTSKNLLGALG